MEVSTTSIAILVIISSIGVPTIIGFIAYIWYNTKRHEELITNLFVFKKEAKEKIVEIEKKQNEDIRTITNTISKMEGTLSHLDKTMSTLSQRFENFFSRNREK